MHKDNNIIKQNRVRLKTADIGKRCDFIPSLNSNANHSLEYGLNLDPPPLDSCEIKLHNFLQWELLLALIFTEGCKATP
jgi:hypothetical protein